MPIGLDADVQVGGTDQPFNIVTAARKLMTALGKKPNIGITMSIVPGTDGEIRMSKSRGNATIYPLPAIQKICTEK